MFSYIKSLLLDGNKMHISSYWSRYKYIKYLDFLLFIKVWSKLAQWAPKLRGKTDRLKDTWMHIHIFSTIFDKCSAVNKPFLRCKSHIYFFMKINIEQWYKSSYHCLHVGWSVSYNFLDLINLLFSFLSSLDIALENTLVLIY